MVSNATNLSYLHGAADSLDRYYADGVEKRLAAMKAATGTTAEADMAGQL